MLFIYNFAKEKPSKFCFMKIKSRIISLLTALALAPGIVSCASEEFDTMDDIAILLSDESLHSATNSEQSGIIGKVTLKFTVTPELVDSATFFAPCDESGRNMDYDLWLECMNATK